MTRGATSGPPSTLRAGPLLRRRDATALLLAVVVVLLSLLLWQRAASGGDQLNLLARGWLLAEQGTLVPYGNPGSSGGVAPGPLTSWLVGLPLAVWLDARSPVLVILLCHLLALWLLDRVLRETLHPTARRLFVLFFALSPLRLFLSGFVWNPNYLLLAGAVHLWSLYRQRERGRFWLSLAHVLCLGLALQLHASAVLLVAASGLLWLGRGWRLSWPGALAGGALVLLSLVPYWQAVAANPALLPVSHGFPGRGLLFVFPFVRGLLLWLRYPSLALPGKLVELDFTPALGAAWDHRLAPLGKLVTAVLGPLTALFVLLTLVWLGRRLWRRQAWRSSAGASPRRWLERYLLACALASVLIFAAAPTTVMWWQGVTLFHAMLLAPTLWTAALLHSRRRQLARLGVTAWAVTAALLTLAMAFGSPQYRCGGREAVQLALAGDPPLLADLGLAARCTYPTNVPGGWWPDVLPPPSGEQRPHFTTPYQLVPNRVGGRP